MADIKQELGTTQNFTLTLASLASSATAGRETTAVDNTSNKYLDYVCQVKVALQTGTPANDKTVYIYAYGSVDGSTYTDNATGTDAAITLREPTAMKLVATIPCPDAGGLTYESQPFSVSHAFGGVMPAKFGLVVRNYTGVTLSATEGNHSYQYRGIYESIT